MISSIILSVNSALRGRTNYLISRPELSDSRLHCPPRASLWLAQVYETISLVELLRVPL